jgi:hypothetical protein
MRGRDAPCTIFPLNLADFWKFGSKGNYAPTRVIVFFENAAGYLGAKKLEPYS